MSIYIEKAKRHLAELSKSIDSEKFRAQYESLNHNSRSILLEDFRIEEFYSFLTEFTVVTQPRKADNGGEFYSQLIAKCVTSIGRSGLSNNLNKDDTSDISIVEFERRPKKENNSGQYRGILQIILNNKQSCPATNHSYTNSNSNNNKYAKAAWGNIWWV